MPTPEEEKTWAAERDAMIKATYGTFASNVGAPMAAPTKERG